MFYAFLTQFIAKVILKSQNKISCEICIACLTHKSNKQTQKAQHLIRQFS